MISFPALCASLNCEFFSLYFANFWGTRLAAPQYIDQIPLDDPLTGASLSVRIYRIFTPLADDRPIEVKQIRHQRHNCTDRPQDGEGILHTESLIDRTPSNSHASRYHISREHEESQSGCRICVVGIDEIHVCNDEDGGDTVAEEDGGNERGPY